MIKGFRFVLRSSIKNKLFKNPANLIKYSFCKKPESINQQNEIYDEVCEPISKTDEKINMDEEVFQTREQQISVELLNCRTAEEIIQVYNQNKDNKITCNELSLCFYFLSFHKDDMDIVGGTLNDIVKNMQPSIEDLDNQYFQTFIWSLGKILFENNQVITCLNSKYRNQLSKEIKQRSDSFEEAQASSLTFAAFYILSHDLKCLHEIIDIFASISIKQIDTLDTPELLNYFMVFTQSRYQNFDIISPFVNKFSQIADKFSQDQLTRIIMILDELNYKQIDQLFFKNMIELAVTYDLTTENACNLILTSSQTIPNEKQLIKELLKTFHRNHLEINISNYVSLWLSLARLKFDPQELEKTFRLMKDVLSKSKIFAVSDLESFELVNILVACSAMKINDKEFIKLIISTLQPLLHTLDNQDQINLARSFLIYVKQFEDFYIQIHNNCEKNISNFDLQEKQLLQQAFNKVKVLFPYSKFIEGSLY